MASLQFLLFGAPRLERLNSEENATVTVRRRKSLALLAYLVVGDKAQSRDGLATLLWPESDQSSARANLRRDLSRLQKDLGGDILRTERDLISVKSNAIRCDVVDFRQKLSAVADHEHGETQDTLCPTCVQWLEEAVDLYKGDFMDGFTLTDSTAFDEWQLFQTERLRRGYGRALQQLLEWHTAHGAFEEALSYASRWLALDMLHEGAQRQLMRLYAWSGQTAAALRQYQECARILKEELGVEPAPETVALYEAIRNQSLPGPTADRRRRTADGGQLTNDRVVAASGYLASAVGGQGSEVDPLPIPFVGRQAQLDTLVAALDDVSAGAGQTILLEGEPGIGKSRLVQEAAQIAVERGVGVLFGKCYQGEESLPYQVVMALLDQALVNWPATTLAQLAPSTLAELTLLAPDIAQRFPDLPRLPRGLEEARQARLFRSITQLLTVLAGDRGLLVVIDDLQWADAVTRLFVTHLAHQSPQERVLLVLTYRTEALAADEELAARLQSLASQPGVQHLTLARLTSSDAEELVQQLPGALPDAPVLAQWLHRETEGNPFFLVSILQSLREQGLLSREGTGVWRVDSEGLLHGDQQLSLPEALREAVRSRLARLPRAVRSILDVAAVYGRSFDFQTLQAITGESATSLLDLLESLMRRQLFVEDDEGRQYDFSHDKIREVVYHDLSGARRRVLHRVIAETLDESGRETPAILAAHFEAARVWDKAVEQLQLAASHARELFAMSETLNFYNRALDAARHDEHAVDEQQKMALREQRGQTRALAGDFDGAVADLQGALAHARSCGERARERALLTQLGMAYRRADDYENARTTLSRALRLAREADDAHSVADNLFHLGTVIWTEGDNRSSAPYQEEAVAICRREGFTDLVAVQATHGRAENFFQSGYYEEAIAYFSESLALAQQNGDRAYEAENLYMQGAVHSGLIGAHYEEARAALEESLRISSAAHLDWHIIPPLFLLCDVVSSLGDYGAALEHGMEAVRLAERLGIIYFKSIALDFLGNLYRGLDLLDKAEEAHAEGAREAELGHAGNWLPRIQADLAIDRLRQDNLEVGDVLKEALETCTARSQELHGARCLEGLAEWALAVGDPQQALAYGKQLQELAEPRGMRESLLVAYQWQGIALTHLERGEEADSRLARALQMAETLGVQCVLRDVHNTLAASYYYRGLADRAAQHEEALKTIVERIKNSLPDPTLRRGLERSKAT